jgi:hypothetical protein
MDGLRRIVGVFQPVFSAPRARPRESAVRRTARHVFLLACLLILVTASGVHGQGQSQPAPEKFVLSGVIVFDGGDGVAWLQEPILTGNHVVTVRPGDRLGPYRLARIHEDRVELEGPTGTVFVPVYNTEGGSGTAVAATGGETRGASRVSLEPVRVPRQERRELLREERQAQRESRREARREVQDQPGETKQPARGAQDDGRKQRGSKARGGSGSTVSDSTASSPTGGAPNVNVIPRGDPRRNGFQQIISGQNSGN